MTNVEIETLSFSDLSRELKEELRREARVCFPQYREIYNNRFYFESTPSVVFIARVDGRIAGFRNLVERTCRIGGFYVRIAGVSLAVNPDFRGRGIATRLTEHMLYYVRTTGFDMVMAFVICHIAAHILEKVGFEKTTTPVRFIDSETEKKMLVEDSTYVLDLKGGAIIKALNEAEEIDVGRGVW